MRRPSRSGGHVVGLGQSAGIGVEHLEHDGRTGEAELADAEQVDRGALSHVGGVDERPALLSGGSGHHVASGVEGDEGVLLGPQVGASHEDVSED